MKKVMFLSTMALMLCFALPQITEASKTQNAVVTAQAKDVKDVKYQEIMANKLPEAVTQTVTKDYEGFKIDKAFLGSDGNYKVEISKETLKHTVFLSEKGEVIKVENPEAKEKKQY